MVAQELGKITEILGHSAYELQKVEARGKTTLREVCRVRNRSERHCRNLGNNCESRRAKQGIVAETNVTHLVCNLLWRSWMVSK